MFTPFGLALPFQRVFGMGHLAAPTAFHQAELEKVEMKVKMPPTSFQDSFNRPPQIIFQPPHVEPETGASVLGEKGMVFVRSAFFCNMAFLSTSRHPFMGRSCLAELELKYHMLS